MHPSPRVVLTSGQPGRLQNFDHPIPTDFGPLERFPNLQHVFLDNTGVSNIDALRSLKSLLSVSLNQSPVTSLAPLARLPALQMINAEKTLVTVIPQWKSDAPLKAIFLRGSPVQDLCPLASIA